MAFISAFRYQGNGSASCASFVVSTRHSSDPLVRFSRLPFRRLVSNKAPHQPAEDLIAVSRVIPRARGRLIWPGIFCSASRQLSNHLSIVFALSSCHQSESASVRLFPARIQLLKAHVLDEL